MLIEFDGHTLGLMRDKAEKERKKGRKRKEKEGKEGKGRKRKEKEGKGRERKGKEIKERGMMACRWNRKKKEAAGECVDVCGLMRWR